MITFYLVFMLAKMLFLCGDLKSRIGDNYNYITRVDVLPDIRVVD